MCAAVRVPRPAARRVLLTVLFLGVLWALAVLFGGSAHAASGPQPQAKGGADRVAQLAAGERDLAGAAHQNEGRDLNAPGQLDHTQRAAGSAASADTNRGVHRVVRSGGSAHQAAPRPHVPERTHAPERTPAPSGSREAVRGGPGPQGTQLRPGHAGGGLNQHEQRARSAAGRLTSEVAEPVRDSAEHTRRATRPVSHAVRQVTADTGLSKVTHRLGQDRRSGGHGAAAAGTGRAAAHRDTRAGDRADALHRSGSGAVRCTPQSADHLTAAQSQQVTAGDAGTGEHRGDGLPGPGHPQHPLPSVPGTGNASPYAGDGGGSRGGPDQLAAYCTDMERFGTLLRGAVHSARHSPVRERPGDILEFPG